MKTVAALGIQLVALVATVGTATTVAAAPAAADSVLYASIAISTATGATAASWDYGSAWAAENAAEGACNASDCVAFVTATSGWCAAVARASDNSWTWARAADRGTAAANAIGAATGRYPRVIQTVCQDAALGIGAIESSGIQPE
ncbi:DUF4189 domain-containing protein [Nocardia asteroides]|uniref:DUF4189 domain-containing protein n=1 Tax=Nocardia asteroides TaxID=1824 RepID=UPI0033ED39E2